MMGPIALTETNPAKWRQAKVNDVVHVIAPKSFPDSPSIFVLCRPGPLSSESKTPDPPTCLFCVSASQRISNATA